jgi:hypothetical protein
VTKDLHNAFGKVGRCYVSISGKYSSWFVHNLIKVAVYFDSDLELCNFADQVNCKTDGNTAEQSLQPPPAPAPAPAPLTTTSSASEAAETEQKDSDLPPWLAHVGVRQDC